MAQAISMIPVLRIRLNFRFLYLLLVLITFFLFFISIYQFNTYTSEVFFISQAEKQLNQLSQENKVLEINLAEANSLGNLAGYAQNFEKAEKIEYLRVLEGTALAR
jgi:cell division protein FtsB